MALPELLTLFFFLLVGADGGGAANIKIEDEF